MMKRKMMLEIDHMSVKAAGQALDIFEAESYPGVLSSHSWMDLNWTERVYRLGGFVAQYMHASKEFVAEADAHRRPARRSTTWATASAPTSTASAATPPRAARTRRTTVTYPFTSVDGGSVIDRQTTGARTWDINTDGAAHYGLIPDWIEDIRQRRRRRTWSTTCSGAPSPTSTPGAPPRRTRPG